MLDSAIAGGNDGEIDTVVKYAGRRAPWAQDAMKKRVNAWRTDRRLRHEAMVEAAGVFELWKGKRSEEHTSELQSLMRISYAVFCLKKKKSNKTTLIKQSYVK